MRSLYKKKKTLYGVAVVIILLAVTYLALPNSKLPDNGENTGKNSRQSVATPSGFDKNAYPTDEAASLWAVVNKGRALPSSYAPSDLTVPDIPLGAGASSLQMHLRTDAASALQRLVNAAKTDGLGFKLVSGYRPYAYQVSIYSSYVKSSSVQQADTFSARPGHSEHQTGLAADVGTINGSCELDQCFGDLPEGRWLALNAHKYGFIIRYQKTTQDLTGYIYEPWHIRYVGSELAARLNDSGQTLEQFFGLPIYASYPAQSLVLKI